MLYFVIKIFFSLWTKIADYTVNMSWGSEGSKSASTSTGGTTHHQHLLHLLIHQKEEIFSGNYIKNYFFIIHVQIL